MSAQSDYPDEVMLEEALYLAQIEAVTPKPVFAMPYSFCQKEIYHRV